MQNPGTLVNGAPRQRRYAPRSKVGCVTCRRRRKRCVGGEPDCEACLRLNLECLRDNRGQFGSQGSHRSRTSPHPLSRNGERPENDGSMGSSSSFMGTGATTTTYRSTNHDAIRPSSIPITPSGIGTIAPTDADQRTLMSYYIHSFVPNISVANVPHSLFTSVYVPMAFHCEAVRSTILACSSAHLAKSARDDSPQRARLLDLSLRYQMKSHQFLQDRISLSGNLQGDMLESMAVILLLVGLEVQNGARTPKWMNQVDCVRNIIRKHGGRRAFCRASWEADCIYQHFLYHDVMSLIMAGVAGKEVDGDDDEEDEDQANSHEDSPSFGMREQVISPPAPTPAIDGTEAEMPWARFLREDDGKTQPNENGDDNNIDPTSPGSQVPRHHRHDSYESVHPLLGLSQNLFYLIQKIRHIKPIQSHPLRDIPFDHSDNAFFLHLERKISSIQFDLYPHIDDDDRNTLALHSSSSAKLDAGTRLDLIALAETYRLAALILLYRRSPAHAHQLPVLASHIITLAERIPTGNAAAAGLTYPLFLAGAELTSEHHILQCATKLTSIRKRFRVMNIQSAEKVLEAVWRERLNGGEAWDWEHVLKKWDWVINLA